jgi:hypothetical protein
MEWHDVSIHGIAALADRFELRFDIDYILEWVCSPAQGEPTQFRIAPATLIFKDAGALRVTLDSQQPLASIDEITRVNRGRLTGASVDTWYWKIKCHEGEISFEASGFFLFLRAAPIQLGLQYLNSEQRGLPSFAAEWPGL